MHVLRTMLWYGRAWLMNIMVLIYMIMLQLYCKNQSCRARTQISGSGSNLWKFLALAPERFGPLKKKKTYCLYDLLAQPTMFVKPGTKFQALAPPSKIFWSLALALAIQNCLWSSSTALVRTQCITNIFSTEKYTSTPGTEICWVNCYSLISVSFLLTCWTFMAKGVQICQ